MEKIKAFYDSQGNTLNVWFDDPDKSFESEETGNETILIKDKKGDVIGFEKLNFVLPARAGKTIPIKELSGAV